MPDQMAPAPRAATSDPNDESIHDEHPSEPAEGAREPGQFDEVEGTQREHPVEPAEGRTDIER